MWFVFPTLLLYRTPDASGALPVAPASPLATWTQTGSPSPFLHLSSLSTRQSLLVNFHWRLGRGEEGPSQAAQTSKPQILSPFWSKQKLLSPFEPCVRIARGRLPAPAYHSMFLRNSSSLVREDGSPQAGRRGYGHLWFETGVLPTPPKHRQKLLPGVASQDWANWLPWAVSGSQMWFVWHAIN